MSIKFNQVKWQQSTKLLKYFSLLFSLVAFSQSSHTISGIIQDTTENGVPFASIILAVEGKFAIADEHGQFKIPNVQKGTYQVEIRSTGFQTISQTIEVSKDYVLNVTLEASVDELEEIVVVGKTEARIISEEPITISSMDITQFQDQGIGTEEVLKMTTGLVIRQSGGLGSGININLNGQSGNAIRTYYDGIPLEVLGNGLQLNTVPVDALERVDVYKGVVPVDVGTDALGGGLNMVPVVQSSDYLRTSYSYGSFNTHRFTFSGLKNLNQKISLSTISYFNYSDNDFKMRDIRSNILTERGIVEEFIDTKRFHDRHISGYIEGKLRIKDLKWADRLEFASSYSRIEQEIQNAGRFTNEAIGEAETSKEVFTQRIDYRKHFFRDQLTARYFGVFSHAVDNVNDSTTNIYNWRGEIIRSNNDRGAEIFENPTFLKRENAGTVHRLTLNYKLTDQIEVKVSDYYQRDRLNGEDPLAELILVEDELIDPNTLSSTFSRNIFGAELNAKLFEDKLSAITFFKNYFYQAKAIDPNRVRDSEFAVNEIRNNSNGYGFALKYEPHPAFFIRSSLEQTIRIPSQVEIFGDLAAVIPNLDLQPEESLNWNIGAQFEKRFNNNRFILLNVNGFIRKQLDLIRPELVSFDRIQFKNIAEVDSKGIELTLKVSPFKNLSLQGNLTNQSNKNAKTDSGNDIGKQVPNIPLTFYNIGLKYKIEDLLKADNSLQISWTYLVIDKFSTSTVSNLATANPDNFVPEQNVHNAGLTYLLKEMGLACSFNLQNIFNAELFDNFRIPRPGINYSLKINYSL